MVRLRGSDLLAVAMPPGPRWLDVLTEAWSVDAAVLPVDHRLPRGEADRVVARALPTVVRQPDGGLRRLTDGAPVESGVRLVMATSGTSAQPRLVELTQDAIHAVLGASDRRIGAHPEDAWLCCLPVAHIGGMLVLLRAVLHGARVVVRPSFDVSDVGAAMARGARFTSLVPTMLRRVLDGRVDVRGFDAILIGGAGMDPALRARAAAAGANVVQTYGLTESTGGVVYDGVPLEGVEVHVTADDGEIRLRGGSLMRGYRFDAPATATAFDRDGWLRTRDAGRLSGGTLTVLGRMDDVIVTGGEKVWPEQVEAALLGDPGIAEVAVAGLPDGTWGQRVVAFVVPVAGTEAPALDRLRDRVARSLPRYAAPKELVLVERMPRTPSGKVRRSALAAEPSGHPFGYPSERAPRPR